MNAPLVAVDPELYIPQGIWDGLPAETYFAVEALSQSGAKKIRKSCADYKLSREQKLEATDSMELGTAIHTGVLEPSEFDKRVCTIDDDAPKKPTSAQRRAKKPSPDTVAAVAWWDEFEARTAGRIVLPRQDFDRARRAIESVLAHPAAAALLAGAVVERSLFWRDRLYGVPCKARLDAWSVGSILVDLKSCRDASPESFPKTVADFEYHAQAAHYTSGCAHAMAGEIPSAFVIIAVETEEPYLTGVYQVPDDAIRAGEHLMSIALERYAKARETGRWPGYAPTIETLRMPRWALRFEG